MTMTTRISLGARAPQEFTKEVYKYMEDYNGRNLQPSPGNCLQPDGETYSPKNLWEFKASPTPMPTMPGKNAFFSGLTKGFWWVDHPSTRPGRGTHRVGLPVILESLFGLIYIYTFRGLQSSISTKKLFWKSK